MGTRDLISQKRLEEFFYHQVRQACFNQQVEAAPHTEFYLVQLLANFSHRSHSDTWDPSNEVPMAIRYLESLQVDCQEGIRLLKQLGDLALYMSGFFQESLRSVGLDYYVSLGGNAYHRAHALVEKVPMHDTFQEIFLELGCKFPHFVEVLCEISENAKISKDSDLLKLYERWLETGSDRILKKLHQAGIYPSDHSPSETKH